MSPKQRKILEILELATRDMAPPMVEMIVEEFGRKPFFILISCLLSLRAKDIVTYPICRKLFSSVESPEDLLAVPLKNLEKLFYPLGFFRKKAQLVHDVSKQLLDEFGGKVPSEESALLSIKGVGRKTAALVLAEGFGIPAICVDTHVHRLSNRIGFVQTSTPHQTEVELKKILPKEWWVKINKLFVTWGQNICTPIAPYCKTRCAIKDLCPKIGVTRMR